MVMMSFASRYDVVLAVGDSWYGGDLMQSFGSKRPAASTQSSVSCDTPWRSAVHIRCIKMIVAWLVKLIRLW